MFRRLALLCFSAWLIAAGGLTAMAAPCQMTPEAAPVATASHCDMAALAGDDAPEPAPAVDDTCCCPAILAALPAQTIPGTSVQAFSLPVSITAPLAPASRNPVPEPPPPKA